MTEIRDTQTIGKVLSANTPAIRDAQTTGRVLSENTPAVRLAQSTAHVLSENTPAVRLAQSTAHILSENTPLIRVGQSFIKVLHSVAESSTDPFLDPQRSRLKFRKSVRKCSEFVSPPCNPVPTDGCCAIIPCAYCLRFVGTYDTFDGTAEFATSAWIGPISGVIFRAYWERNYTTGECEFIAELDGVEVYRNDCYGGVSCRDSSDSATVTIAGDTGLLTWTRIDPLELPHVIDDSNCRTWFCDDCECSCDCLCVMIVDGYDGRITRGEICNTTYDPCNPPVWEGTVGDYYLSLALGRDEYGNCVIIPSIDGATLDAVSAAGCGNMAAVIELYDGTTITVVCKVCSCEPSLENCCPDLTVWPTTLTIEISDPDGCFNLSGTLTEIDPMGHTYGGTVTGSCTPACSGITADFNMEVLLTCSANGGWLLQFEFNTPPDDCLALPPDTVLTQVSCDPIYLSGDIDCFSCPGMVCPGIPNPPDPPLPYPHPPFCPSVIVYETP